MKKIQVLKLIIRLVLFSLILILGTMIALVVNETPGLALVDLNDVSVQTIATAAQGNVLYAGVAGTSQSSGLYRSLDNGHTWQLAGSLPQPTVNALTVRPDNRSVLYAGGPGGPMATTNNLWRSEDGGQSWRKYNLNLPANPQYQLPAVTSLAVDPNRPDVLYVGTDGQGVYRFEESRLGYELVGGVSMYNGHIRSLVIGPDSRLYALTPEGLFTTQDDVWQKLEALPELAISLAIAPDKPQTLYAGSASSGLYRSLDGGQSWERLNQGLDMPPGAALRVTALAIDPENPGHLALATAYGLGSQLGPGHLYESHNAGDHWDKVADLESLVTNLTISNDVIHAVTANGMRQYGESTGVSAEPVSATPLGELRTLIHPSGTQILILVLTLGLAALALLAPIDWLMRRRQATGQG